MDYSAITDKYCGGRVTSLGAIRYGIYFARDGFVIVSRILFSKANSIRHDAALHKVLLLRTRDLGGTKSWPMTKMFIGTLWITCLFNCFIEQGTYYKR